MKTINKNDFNQFPPDRKRSFLTFKYNTDGTVTAYEEGDEAAAEKYLAEASEKKRARQRKPKPQEPVELLQGLTVQSSRLVDEELTPSETAEAQALVAEIFAPLEEGEKEKVLKVADLQKILKYVLVSV